MVEYSLVLIASLLMCLLATPITMTFAKKLGIVDWPGGRKIHGRPMPRSGGIAIAASIFLSLSPYAFNNFVVQGVLLGALIVFVVGVIDDKWGISPKYKLTGQVLAAAAFIWWSGISLHSLGNLFGAGPIETGEFAVLVTIIGIVGVTNAMNLLDGLDGLASGSGAIACIFFAIFAYISKQWDVFFIIIAMFGALLGFLYYNIHPAKVFMGDSGSLLLGYMLATIAVLLTEQSEHLVPPISMALVLALPIVDTLVVMTQRVLKGRSPFSPDKTHLHHRLLNLGLSQQVVVSILYSIMVLFGLIAVYLRHVPDWAQLVIGAGLALLVYSTVMVLNTRASSR